MLPKQINNIQINPFEIINEGNQRYLYNLTTNGLFILDDISYQIITNNLTAEINESDYNQAVEFMKEKYIIRTEENEATLKKLYNKSVQTKQEMKPTSLVLMLSQECKMKIKNMPWHMEPPWQPPLFQQYAACSGHWIIRLILLK